MRGASDRAAVYVVLAVGLAGCRLRTQGTSNDAGTESDSAVALGQLAVERRKCAQCHQSLDPQDGVLSGQATPVPDAEAYGSNLTPDPDTGMDAWDAASVAIALTQGYDSQGNPLCPAMPVYCDMTSEEAFAIAAYLQSLTPVWHSIPASVCPPYEPLPDGGIPVSRGAVCGD